MFKFLLLTNVLAAAAFAVSLYWAFDTWAPPLSKPVGVAQAFQAPGDTLSAPQEQPVWFAQLL